MNHQRTFWIVTIATTLAMSSITLMANQNRCGAAAPVIQDDQRCGCSKCGSAKRCRQCPKCQNDVCVLNAQCVKDPRVCFEVEQKLICIPKLNLPWRRCGKPCGGDCASNCRQRCGKTKTVKVLKTKVYECDVCKYSWKVYEAEEQSIPTDSMQNQQQQPVAEPPFENDPQQPQFDETDMYDPSGDDVPKAPTMNDAARALLKRFNRRR